MRIFCHIALYAVVCLTGISCRQVHHEHPVYEKFAGNTSPPATGLSSAPFLAGKDKHPVSANGKSFYVQAREPQVLSYPCHDCHDRPVADLKAQAPEPTHWNIALGHADQEKMNCFTCHDNKNMDNLRSLTGTRYALNDSHLLCAQCHSGQYNDWAGGAHGKRLGSWAPPRVSLTCTACHDPHKPAIGHRWPARYKGKPNLTD